MLANMPITELIISLIILIFLSAFFSSAETGLMALNRYRLRYLVAKGQRTARLIQTLLKRPDRILGVILIGNTFAVIMASSFATIIAIHFWHRLGIAISTIGLTLIMLIFAEITPKTLAALYPAKISYAVAWPLWILLWILYPMVWLGNAISNNLLRLFGIKVSKKAITEALTTEELRILVSEFGERLSTEDQQMLLNILSLRQITVEDIMIPRNEIVGIDLDDDWDDILDFMRVTPQEHLLVYQGGIDNAKGVLSVRTVLNLLLDGELTQDTLQQYLMQIHFVAQTTSLKKQLSNFRRQKYYLALVVNEYGDIVGMLDLYDIFEEIVGEFVVDVEAVSKEIYPQTDGSYIVDGSIFLRELNRSLQLKLPISGPKTLSGLIVEELQDIPRPHTCMKLAGHPVEILSVTGNMVKAAKIFPKLYKK
jgi:Mg2+/Co2+ transporter CorB